MRTVQNKNITVLGAARSGLAAAGMLKALGANIFVSDSGPAKNETVEALKQMRVGYEFGEHSARALEAEYAVISPGISLKTDIVKNFTQQNIPLYSEIETASWYCKAPYIAVSGSNGKTTTSSLLGEMLKTRYPETVTAGNIGKPFSSFVHCLNTSSRAVVEVSSFQLETVKDFHPKTALLLNFAPNHLDRYKTYRDYIETKWRITKNLGTTNLLIYNSDDRELTAYSKRINCRKEGFSISGNQSAHAFYASGKIYLHNQELIRSDELLLRGKHNYMNVMAAALAAVHEGVTFKQIGDVLNKFKGIEHRSELVREFEGVKYINDSKATTIESLSCALQSFEEPLILIAGGKDKGSDFTRVNSLISEHVRQIVLIGSATEKMEQAWGSIKPILKARSLIEAIGLAKDAAAGEGVVLLSPACASFDMFIDFEDRGRQFKELVNKL